MTTITPSVLNAFLAPQIRAEIHWQSSSWRVASFASCVVSMLGINTGLSVSQGCQSVIFHIHREQVLPFKIRNTVNRNSSLIKAYFSTWKKIKKSRKSPSPHLEPYSTSQAMSKEYKVKSESLSLEEGKRSTQVSVKDMMAYGS